MKKQIIQNFIFREGGVFTADDKMLPIIPFNPVDEDGMGGLHRRDDLLLKSLSYLKDRFEFIEQDNEGIKMRVKSETSTDKFPYEVGFLVISDYDDRKFLVTKIDEGNRFIWFGLWEE